jgi:hypothetical protein
VHFLQINARSVIKLLQHNPKIARRHFKLTVTLFGVTQTASKVTLCGGIKPDPQRLFGANIICTHNKSAYVNLRGRGIN